MDFQLLLDALQAHLPTQQQQGLELPLPGLTGTPHSAAWPAESPLFQPASRLAERNLN